jgi:hypothetical protein
MNKNKYERHEMDNFAAKFFIIYNIKYIISYYNSDNIKKKKLNCQI